VAYTYQTEVVMHRHKVYSAINDGKCLVNQSQNNVPAKTLNKIISFEIISPLVQARPSLHGCINWPRREGEYFTLPLILF